jgi:hypothetical protein
LRKTWESRIRETEGLLAEIEHKATTATKKEE